MDAGVLLVLTVNTCRHPGAYRAALGSNYGYGGGALVVMGARAYREREGRRRRDGQAKMYFLSVEVQDQSIVMALPSDGRSTPCSDGSASITSIAAFARWCGGAGDGAAAHGFEIIPWRLPGLPWLDPR